ncbi:hypothetical protein CXF68_13260 [Tenacibaculum sp. Bg11-29]|uniref:hypothetical protein n=1 Tax=Tenacibaculum sp. Bg11-29 TaxID=2058306 RepID=UPI000C32DDF9|nr:hypothetical protein [Tenacibaculum sp. Bg11-29]PKH51592.1 hypothetical protein CXF68_13260 [Tenacibaculum sp. Bg11-29]
MNKSILEEKMTHNILIEKIFEQYEVINKHKITSLFLSSLSSKNLKWRSGLSVYAIMQSFPKHEYTLREDASINNAFFKKMSPSDKEFTLSRFPCKFCADVNQLAGNKEFTIECFNEVGGIIGFSLFDYYYNLEQFNEFIDAKPSNEDFRIFSEIITILLEADEKDTVKKTVLSKIGKIKGFKSDKEQRQALLETLGYCSILETDEHKGFLKKYTNFASAPKKSHSSDWNYPVDFWLGKEGINKEAFKFWFGEYPQLEKFWK